MLQRIKVLNKHLNVCVKPYPTEEHFEVKNKLKVIHKIEIYKKTRVVENIRNSKEFCTHTKEFALVCHKIGPQFG